MKRRTFANLLGTKSTMLLYHVKRGGDAATIAAKGLLTRESLPEVGKGNWEDYPSRDDLVYFSRFVLYEFAFDPRKSGAANVFEIDTGRLPNAENFCPDDDLLAMELAMSQGMDISKTDNETLEKIASLRKNINPIEYQAVWKTYLERTGNTCHIGDVPSDAITRYAVMDVEKMGNVKRALDALLARCESLADVEGLLDPLTVAIFEGRDYENLSVLFELHKSEDAREFVTELKLGCASTRLRK